MATATLKLPTRSRPPESQLTKQSRFSPGTFWNITAPITGSAKDTKEFIPDKAMDEDYYLLTLMAVARELNVFSIQEADVHLAAGLPLTWIRNQREEFRSYLLQNPEVSYRFNNKDYHIRFVGCSLYPQGYPQS